MTPPPTDDAALVARIAVIRAVLDEEARHFRIFGNDGDRATMLTLADVAWLADAVERLTGERDAARTSYEDRIATVEAERDEAEVRADTLHATLDGLRGKVEGMEPERLPLRTAVKYVQKADVLALLTPES